MSTVKTEVTITIVDHLICTLSVW